MYLFSIPQYTIPMSRLKKFLLHSLIITLLGIFYQITFCFYEAYSQESTLEYVKQIGVKGVEKGQFINPHSLATDKFGNIFVGDTGNKRVQKFSPNGTFMLSWGSEGNKSGQFMGLHDVAVDPEGKFVFTVELKNHRVQKFSTDGSFITKWEYNGTGGRDVNRAPHQIAVNSLGIVYLTDSNGNQLLKYHDNGTFIGTIGSAGVGPGKFSTPHGIAFDPSNNMYVTDMKNYRIQVFDANDSFIREWKSAGMGPDKFSETVPGIALDAEGQVYIVDKINSRVQMFDNTGNHLSSWGTDGKGQQQLHKPEDISVSKDGTIYVTDTRNSRIQVLQIMK